MMEVPTVFFYVLVFLSCVGVGSIAAQLPLLWLGPLGRESK